ncbi:aromatic ring-hydroxylating dioxygenase subunit alpha [soil metagenome]
MTTETRTKPGAHVNGNPVSAEEVAPVRQPVGSAHLLPPRVFHDPAIFAYEQEAWFATTWLCVGRDEDVAEPGTYLLARAAGESVMVVRGRDRRLRAFNNVCRHRGATILDDPEGISGRVVRLQCPYHAWTYDLDGSLRRAPHTEQIEDFASADYGLHSVRLETWQGFVFVNLSAAAPALTEYLADLPAHVERYAVGRLLRGRRIEYDVAANWKVIAENYSECYHCPGVHPQLNKLSPYDRGQNLESKGPWAGGWMELIDEAHTMSTDGASHGRPPLAGISTEDQRKIFYFVLWPNLLISLHPDYVMTHQVWPVDAEHSRVICEWFFEPETMAAPDFGPSDAVDFWDLTNRQDWAVCERQQEGTRSRAYVAGRYSRMEDMVHAFDLMVADRYADDGVTTRFAPRHDKWSAAPRRRGALAGG